MAIDEYRLRCAELATATARRDADLEAAEQSYVDEVAELTSGVTSAEAALSTVDGELSTAQRRVGRVDAEATALWGRAGDLVGLRRLGPLPGPALSTVDPDPIGALDRVEAALRRYRVGVTRTRLSGRVLVLLPVLGAIGALTTVLCGHSLGLDIAGLVLGPVPGYLAARRFFGWLDAGATALTVLGALLAGGVAVVALS